MFKGCKPHPSPGKGLKPANFGSKPDFPKTVKATMKEASVLKEKLPAEKWAAENKKGAKAVKRMKNALIGDEED